jgi:hypothetical protein
MPDLWNISDAPLTVNLAFNSKIADGWVQESIVTLESQVPLLASALSQLQPYLTTPLGVLFNAIWTNIQGAQKTSAQSAFVTLMAQNGESVNSVNATFPSSGSLFATAYPAWPPEGSTPGGVGSLALTFTLPGCDISFDTGSVTAEWDISFDAALVISTSVPLLPFSLAFVSKFVLSNANLNTDNVVAWFENAVVSIADFLTLGAIPTLNQVVQNDTDNVSESAGVPGIGTLAGTLNSAGPLLTSNGFTQCGFSVVGPLAIIPLTGSLTLTLTHPLDAAPLLENANDPQGSLSSKPTLSASDNQVLPGGTISVVGGAFPIASMTKLTVEWSNTSSGTAVGAQIKYEVQGQNTVAPISIPLSALSNGMYRYAASPLTADTEYIFWARCGDALTWSEWSAPLTIKTAQTNLVYLVLRPVLDPSGAGVVIGTADLSETSGIWNCQAQIPSIAGLELLSTTGTAYGTYDLIAELSGAVLATTTINIVELLGPQIVMIDTTTNPPTVITSPGVGADTLMGGSKFTVRGENFPIGEVTVKLNGVTAGTPNATNGEFVLTLTVPGSQNSPEQLITVTASSGGISAAPLSFLTTPAPH